MAPADTAHHYRDAAYGAQTSPPHQQEVLADFLRRALGLRRAARALDLGSGRGANLPRLTSHADLVVAADVSESALVDARQRHRDSVVGVRPVVVPGHGLPFRSGAFDLTVCTEVLEHVDDLAGTAAELERVTRPGGHLVVSTPNYRNVVGVLKLWHDARRGRRDWDPWHAHEGGLERFMTPGRLRRVFVASDIIEARGADYATALGVWWKPLRRRVNRHLLLKPGHGAFKHFGMQQYLLLRRR